MKYTVLINENTHCELTCLLWSTKNIEPSIYIDALINEHTTVMIHISTSASNS